MGYLIGTFLLKVFGWKVDGYPPKARQYVFICAPHTSNWDGFWLLMFAWHMRLKVRWMVKDSWTKGWRGALTAPTGALGVDRSHSHDVVGLVANLFKDRDDLILGIAASGTRAKRDYLKSGFYFIAKTAGVPICMGYLDWATKTGGLGPLLEPTGDLKADMETIRAFYKGKMGRWPELMTPMRVRQEDEDPKTAAEPAAASSAAQG